MDSTTVAGAVSSDDSWEDLVVSILAVNQYSLERAHGLLGELREQRLTDPKFLEQWEPEEVEKRLKATGFDRGPFMNRLFAGRLSGLGEMVRSKGIDTCTKVIGSRKPDEIAALLKDVKGIGPVVLRNYYVLRGFQS